ncbi:hypothetical protein BYT27DRAFT_7081226 [Phlegmacium glaucopus]|nr:hypothetical protein BYT27DRAFT_7081226 [Phlegmacium glaucopus]
MTTATQPYSGLRRKLVLAFDVGTTFSGISYSILDPNQVPEIRGVTKFPAQEHVSGSSKIPTVLYYDKDGAVRAVGAETLTEGIYEMAEEGGWFKVEWFKLHLRPNSAKTREITQKLPPLPDKKQAVEILADFLRYMYRCGRTYIEESHANGADLWASVESEIQFILTHPNGWEGVQQTQMREAAVKAGLIPDTTAGRARVAFVTEGEASLHFAIKHGLPAQATKTDDGVVIVDAGGGTVDVSAYSRTSNTARQSFEEIAQPQCHFHGSVFVSILCRLFLEGYLAESDFLEDLDHIVRCFDKTTKLRFRSADEPQFVKFGSTRDNDADCNIRYGQLKLTGLDVASFFEPSVQCIIESVQEQRKAAHKKFTHVVLVGGFAASDWLYKQVSEALREKGFSVVRPDHHVNKAVADGAISYYIDHFVQTRVSKLTYGSRGSIDYNSNDAEHRKRSTFTAISGIKRIDNVFWVILSGASTSNKQVPETNEIRRSHYWEFTNLTGLSSAKSYIYCYRGIVTDAAFMDTNAELYSELCTIEVDLSHLWGTPTIQTIPKGSGVYYKVAYELVMLFGGTEIEVQVCWKEHVRIHFSPKNLLDVWTDYHLFLKMCISRVSRRGRISFSFSFQF